MGIKQQRRRRCASAAQSAAYKIETSNRQTKQGRERGRASETMRERERHAQCVGAQGNQGK